MAQRIAVAWLSVALAWGCANSPIPVADEAIDWTVAAQPWSIQLVTRDPDGARRVTRMRIVEVDGVGVVRTGESRWGENLERGPLCHLRGADQEHPLRAEPVASTEERQRIDAVFLEKYGWQERLFQALWLGEVHFFRLRAAGPSSSEGGSLSSVLTDSRRRPPVAAEARGTRGRPAGVPGGSSAGAPH